MTNQKSEIGFFIDQAGLLRLNLAAPPAWLAGLRVELPCGQTFSCDFYGVSPPEPFSVPQFVSSFLDHLQVNEQRRPHTLAGYRQRLGQFVRWLQAHPDQPPAQPDTWLAYYAGLVRHQPAYSPYHLRNHYDALNRFSRWLLERRHLAALPLAGVKRPAPTKDTEPRAIEKKHINRMLAMATDPRDWALLVFFRDTGCRADEALQLTWGKLRLDEGKTEVIGKGDKARRLFFKALTRRALEKYRATLKRAGPDDPVWQGKRGPLSYNGLYKAFKRLAQAAGLGDEIFNPHAWRHAFGRDTTIKGIPTAQLQKLLGHSRIDTTQIYTRFNTMELQQAHARYSPVNGDLTSNENGVK
jgi:integrase/recombinase XerC